MTRSLCSLSIVIGTSVMAGSCVAQGAAPDSNRAVESGRGGESARAPQPERLPRLGKAEGMVMLDYGVIKVPGDRSIDLMGFHFLNRMNDWLYLGVGGYAPLFKGEYGGFMALDATTHVQRRLFGSLVVDAGVSLGGGGGGKSVEQSKILSGTGRFIKTYVGLGYGFQDFSVGLNVARMKFQRSAIDDAQLNVFVQFPFSYAVGPYASAGERLSPSGGAETGTGDSETVLTLGLDNLFQINPRGSNTGTINIADLQFSHFITRNGYWFANAGVGYRGMPLYNQVLGGLGYRAALFPRVNLYVQLGLGSGGYSNERIDTGPGLLIYPKVSAEYLFGKNLGLAFSAGYLFAPKGSSKNYTVGASLNYHIRSAATPGANDGGKSGSYQGYRVSLFQQTEFDVEVRGVLGSRINLLATQFDSVVSEHVYIPVQVGIAYNAYLGYPGYGELLAGVGVQSKYHPDSRLQGFGQLLLGTNSHGAIVKTGVGLNVGLTDRLALYGLAGQTFGIDKDRFRSNYLALGVTYRFSVPRR